MVRESLLTALLTMLSSFILAGFFPGHANDMVSLAASVVNVAQQQADGNGSITQSLIVCLIVVIVAGFLVSAISQRGLKSR